MSQATATRNTITLKGSATIVSEFFSHAVNRCWPWAGRCGRWPLLQRPPPASTSSAPCARLLSPRPACSILYQRGIYPPDTFQQKKYRNTMVMLTKDKGLAEYLTQVTGQMEGEAGPHIRRGGLAARQPQPPLPACPPPSVVEWRCASAPDTAGTRRAGPTNAAFASLPLVLPARTSGHEAAWRGREGACCVRCHAPQGGLPRGCCNGWCW
jgi:hypothetical protein